MSLTTIAPDLLDNAGEFTDAFYQQFPLRRAAAPLALADGIAKDYLFPTLYGDVTQAVAVFFCSYAAAKKLLPDPSLRPVPAGIGRALAVVTSYRYNEVRGMNAYNEIAVAIPVWGAGAGGISYYVAAMPVTSLENQLRGRKIWGLPKVAAPIALGVEGSDYVTRSGGMELRVPATGATAATARQLCLVSQKDGKLLRSRSQFRGDFAASTNWRALLPGRPVAGASAALRLGEGPLAELLRTLKVGSVPFKTLYGTGIKSAFDLPE